MAYQALRTGYDTTTGNRIGPQVPVIFLKLRFRDPENNIVDFPAGVRVLAEFGGARDRRYEGTTGAGGVFRFSADQVASDWVSVKTFFQKGSPWQTFTLRWDTEETQYIVCDHATPPVAVLATDDLDALPSPPAADRRYFSLPRVWKLRQANLDPAPVVVGAQGTWRATDASITHANVKQLRDIGSVATPVEIVLKPVWTHLRFEYFDRWFGPNPRGQNAGGIGAKVTIPPVSLEGFRTTPNPADADPTDLAQKSPDYAYVHSNWTRKDGDNHVQCLPWILARKDDDSDIDVFSGATLGLRFSFADAQSFAFSVSATARNILHVDPDPPPGPQRLRYYRLPRLWKSRNYYTRGVQGAAPNAKFFGDLVAADINAANGTGTALKFCLDDIVLTFDNAGVPTVLELADTDKVTIYHHRFSKMGNDYDEEGVYKPGPKVTAVDEPYPYSNVVLPAADKYGGAADKRYYLNDYPDWTRLVLAQGNLFEAFDARTPATCTVVGARAAVRWIDATTGAYGKAALVDFNAPRPAVVLKPAGAAALFAIQSFYWQRYLTSYGGGNPEAVARRHNEWTADYGTENDQIGRYDMAMLRCSDRDASEDEVAVLFRYIRLSFDFTTNEPNPNPPPANFANPAVASPAVAREGWIKFCIDNATARWNGHDTDASVSGGVNSPAWIVPRTLHTPPLQIQVVTAHQHLKNDWAHFCVKTLRPQGRSSMSEISGRGKFRINCVIQDSGPTTSNDAWGIPKEGRGLAAAHELGHAGSMPDDYINGSSNSPNAAHLCLLGAPYVHETQEFQNGVVPAGKSLMQGNWWMRARYFWHAAEWARLLPALGAVKFKVKHPPEDDFFVPSYGDRTIVPSATHRNRNFVNWPIAFNLRATTGGGTLFDTVLWAFGKDQYSTEILPGKMTRPPGANIDGMLVVLFRIQVDFADLPGNAAAARSFRNALLTALRTEYFDSRLCFQRLASFEVCGGNRVNAPVFERCLLHFMPCLYTTGGIHDDSAAGLMAGSPPHLVVTMSGTAAADAWNGGGDPKTMTIKTPDPLGPQQAQVDIAAAKIWQRSLQTLGLTDASPPAAGSYFSPASYANIVATVTDAASPPLNPPVVR